MAAEIYIIICETIHELDYATWNILQNGCTFLVYANDWCWGIEYDVWYFVVGSLWCCNKLLLYNFKSRTMSTENYWEQHLPYSI